MLLGGQSWTLTDVPIVLPSDQPDCLASWRTDGSDGSSHCAACTDDSSYNRSAHVAGKAVLITLHGCTVQDKAHRLYEAGAIAVISIARRDVEFLGLYSKNSKQYISPMSGRLDRVAPAVMVEKYVGKALLALLSVSDSPASLRVNLTAQPNPWDSMYGGPDSSFGIGEPACAPPSL